MGQPTRRECRGTWNSKHLPDEAHKAETALVAGYTLEAPLARGQGFKEFNMDRKDNPMVWNAWCINPIINSTSWLVSKKYDDGTKVEGTKQYRADTKEAAQRLAQQLTYGGEGLYNREQLRCMEVTGFTTRVVE